MTIQELITELQSKCVDLNKEVLMYDYEWDQENAIDCIDFDSDGNVVLY